MIRGDYPLLAGGATPLAELFHPAPPRRQRPHRLRDLSMLGLALIIIAAAATQVLSPSAASAPEGRN